MSGRTLAEQHVFTRLLAIIKSHTFQLSATIISGLTHCMYEQYTITNATFSFSPAPKRSQRQGGDRAQVLVGGHQCAARRLLQRLDAVVHSHRVLRDVHDGRLQRCRPVRADRPADALRRGAGQAAGPVIETDGSVAPTHASFAIDVLTLL